MAIQLLGYLLERKTFLPERDHGGSPLSLGDGLCGCRLSQPDFRIRFFHTVFPRRSSQPPQSGLTLKPVRVAPEHFLDLEFVQVGIDCQDFNRHQALVAPDRLGEQLDDVHVPLAALVGISSFPVTIIAVVHLPPPYIEPVAVTL